MQERGHVEKVQERGHVETREKAESTIKGMLITLYGSLTKSSLDFAVYARFVRRRGG